MNSTDQKPDTRQERRLQMLETAFGEEILTYLSDPEICEIMLNPDGRLWVDRLGKGCEDTGKTIYPDKAQQVIELVASATNAVCNAENPLISAELPGSGHRFEGILPPIVDNPTFSIRTKAIKVFSLDEYINQGIITKGQKEIIVDAVYAKENILVAGGTSSGKTTLLNAILREISQTNDRLVIIEDTKELQCTAPNTVSMRTSPNISMNDLLKSTMRLRPDRIVVGEVRGPEALTLIKSWNTGHGGGCSSTHANNCKAALQRIESLVLEQSISPQRELIAEAIHLIINIEKYQQGRRIKEMVLVEGYENGKYILKEI